MNKKHSLNPATIYQLSRRTKADADAIKPNSSTPDETTDLDQLNKDSTSITRAIPGNQETQSGQQDLHNPELLYRYGKLQRSGKDAKSAEDVLLEVHMQRSREKTLALFANGTAQSESNAQQVREVSPGASGNEGKEFQKDTGNLAKTSQGIFSLPAKLLDKAQIALGKLFNNSFPKIAIPAAAMAVLAVVLIPAILTNNKGDPDSGMTLSSVTEVPESLVANADEIAEHIAVAPNASLGFSSDTSLRSRFFELGTLVTSVTVAVAANDMQNQQELLIILERFAESESQDAVKSSIDNLLAELSEPTHTESSVAGNLASLNTSVADSGATQMEQDWYLLGQNLEAVQLANDYALEQDKSTPISDALNQLKSGPAISANDTQTTRLTELLQELELTNNANFPTRADLRKIDTVLSQIRLLLK